jgi:hypothetical protein
MGRGYLHHTTAKSHEKGRHIVNVIEVITENISVNLLQASRCPLKLSGR